MLVNILFMFMSCFTNAKKTLIRHECIKTFVNSSYSQSLIILYSISQENSFNTERATLIKSKEKKKETNSGSEQIVRYKKVD